MKEIIKKLYDAKKEIGKISKDSTNPFFKSKYFDINQVLEHVEPILEKNGLLLLQPLNDGNVVTEIYDIESGESVSSYMTLPELSDPQKLGSAITYFRRYTLQSLLSLQAGDDDGNLASKATTIKIKVPTKQPVKTETKPPAKPKGKPQITDEQFEAASNSTDSAKIQKMLHMVTMSDAQRKDLKQLIVDIEVKKKIDLEGLGMSYEDLK